MTLFDTHAHYDSRQFDCDRDAVLSVLPEQGVALVVNPGCDLLSSCKAVELAQRYWKENPPRALQQNVFRRQMELAQSLRLPVIVHDREAHGDCLDIVRAYPKVTGVFHCFSGSVEMARELVDRGWMISFTGVLTYPNARKAVEAAQAVPLACIMVETDSPYMAPVPFRGKRCDSSLVRYTCQRLAEIKGISPEECARITLENGKRFFSIP